MKDFLITLLILALLFTGWIYFLYRSEQETEYLTAQLESNVTTSIESENWKDSLHQLSHVQDRWNSFRKFSMCFTSSDLINEIDISLAKTSKYIQAEDQSNSTGEIQAVCKQLSLLRRQEALTLQNIL